MRGHTVHYLDNLKQIASRIADAGCRGGTAYRPSPDEIVGMNDINLIIEQVKANWDRRREVTNHSIRYDVVEDCYVMKVTLKNTASRHHATDPRTAALLRRY